MKTINLQEFHAEVKKLAVKKGKTVCVAGAELSEYSSGQSIAFRCYVEGYSFYTGDTPQEALLQLRKAMFPVKRPIPTVEAPL